MEIPSSSVVSRQNYDAATLAGPLSNQIAALKAAGAQVIVMATIPAATALAMLPGAAIGYLPQYVISNVGADSPTVGPLLASFTQKGGGSAAQAKAATGLLNGVITDAYFAPESDVSNPWVQVEKKLLQDYAPALYAKSGLDGNTQYGVALAYTFVQALQAAGKNLTRASLLAAIAGSGKNFVTPGFVPLSYSSTVHYGFRGLSGHQAEQHRTAGGDAHRELDRQHPGRSGGGDRCGIGVRSRSTRARRPRRRRAWSRRRRPRPRTNRRARQNRWRGRQPPPSVA